MKSDGAFLSRRHFLRQGAGAAAALGLGMAKAGATQPIVDSHVHFYDPFRAGGIPWPPSDNIVLYSPHLPQPFRALTQGLGVVGVVAIEAEALPDDNQWVLDLAKTEPLILGYIARLTPGQPAFAAHFDQYLTSPIFRGVRLKAGELADGLGKKEFQRGLREIAGHHLAVDVVGDASMIPDVRKLAGLEPNLPIVIDHLPFVEWDRDPAAIASALRPVAELANVHAKISYVLRRVNGQVVTDPGYYRRTLDTLWGTFGDDRVIYGSNWPVSDLMAPYAAVLDVVADYVRNKSPAAAEKYFWKNSLAAYRWKPRGAAAHLSSK